MSGKLKLNTHLYLVGARGAGKSHEGKLLAQELDAPFYDVDELIYREQGRSIARIVQEEGWGEFRAMESGTLMRLSTDDAPSVIATGGGVVLDEDNIRLMRNSGVVIYLEVPVPVLVERVKGAVNADHRPPLTDLPLAQEMTQMMREREKLYRAAATAAVDGSLSEQEVTGVVMRLLAGDNS